MRLRIRDRSPRNVTSGTTIVKGRELLVGGYWQVPFEVEILEWDKYAKNINCLEMIKLHLMNGSELLIT